MRENELSDKLRSYRLSKNLKQHAVAEGLGVSVAFWSAIENGKKSLPKDKLEIAAKIFELNQEQKEELEVLASAYQNVHQLDISNCRPDTRKMVAAFARRFESLDEQQVSNVFGVITGDDNGRGLF